MVRKYIVQNFVSSAVPLLLILSMLMLTCKKKRANPDPDRTGLAKMEEVLRGDNQQLSLLLEKVRGSVGKRGAGSKTIWSRRNDYRLGLYVSAAHVHGLSGRPNSNAYFYNLDNENPGIFQTSQLPSIDGGIVLGNSLIADFPLIHFDISPEATNVSILPREDFYLGIVDNQRIVQPPLPQYPKNVQKNVPLELYDPQGRTVASQSWNVPVAGEMALAVGYPQDQTGYPNGAAGYGKILTESEVRSVMQQLKSHGDAEGSVPYDPDAEFFVSTKVLPGMSGGGVFNAQGQLLGVMVRGSDAPGAPPILRVVRLAFIRSKMISYFQQLSEIDREKLRPYIAGEL